MITVLLVIGVLVMLVKTTDARSKNILESVSAVGALPVKKYVGYYGVKGKGRCYNVVFLLPNGSTRSVEVPKEVYEDIPMCISGLLVYKGWEFHHFREGACNDAEKTALEGVDASCRHY